MGKKIIAFNYFGGKFNHIDFILKRLPDTRAYIEVFGGSAAILLNKKPTRIEAYNDVNLTVVNFFRTLRDKRDELCEAIYLTPYSLDEYKNSFLTMNEGTDVERARKFYVVVNQSFNANTARLTGWKMSTVESRALISEALNRWLSKINNLGPVIERLKQVQICNYDFRQIFEKFDDDQALFYCDPPYMHDVRATNNEYNFEMTNEDHIELLELARTAKAKVAISGYDCELYNSTLKDFYKCTANEKRDTILHSARKEVLWTNYDPDHCNLTLFKSHPLEVSSCQ